MLISVPKSPEEAAEGLWSATYINYNSEQFDMSQILWDSAISDVSCEISSPHSFVCRVLTIQFLCAAEAIFCLFLPCNREKKKQEVTCYPFRFRTLASKKSKELDKRGVIGEWVTSYLLFLAHCRQKQTKSGLYSTHKLYG